ncbi:hypothetical protein BH09MYX1_BH09MYX1_41090 [soil metagenome]
MTSRVHRALSVAVLSALAWPAFAACGGKAVGDDCQSVVPDAKSSCGYDVQLIGDVSACGFGDGGNVDPATCKRLCGEAASCWYSSGNTLSCGSPCPGRKPSGLTVESPPGKSAGAYLARAAFYEAASFDAFQILARELEAWGAPAVLTRDARAAAADEARHARTIAALAERYEGATHDPKVVQTGTRSLFAIALENAVEGCVHETFAAAVAAIQGCTARDLRLRRAMKEIAGDEARHADLAWRVAAWIEPKLTPGERAKIDSARRAAAASLLPDLLDDAAHTELGVPVEAAGRTVARTLFAELDLLAA